MQTSFSSCAGSSSAARPASKKVRLAATSGGAAGSAEQPATLLAQVEQIGHYPAKASSSAAPPAPRSAAVLHSLHPVVAPMIWQSPELSNRLWDLMRLQDKACSRCTCRFDHQRITTHAFVEQVLKKTLRGRGFLSEPYSLAVRPHTSDQCFARCKELSIALRQAQLARKVRRGEIPDGQEAFTCTETDRMEMLNEWRNDWAAEHYNAPPGLERRILYQRQRSAFNAYIFQETGGHRRLLVGLLHFDLIHLDLPSLPVLVEFLDMRLVATDAFR